MYLYCTGTHSVTVCNGNIGCQFEKLWISTDCQIMTSDMEQSGLSGGWGCWILWFDKPGCVESDRVTSQYQQYPRLAWLQTRYSSKPGTCWDETPHTPVVNRNFQLIDFFLCNLFSTSAVVTDRELFCASEVSTEIAVPSFEVVNNQLIRNQPFSCFQKYL